MRHLAMPLVAAAASMVLITAPASADLGDQLFKLLAKDGEAGDVFGFSVAISGSIGVVGAVVDDDNGPNSGSAYLFDVTTGRQIGKLLPNDGVVDDLFGFSVAISGTTAIVGAPQNDDNGFDSGSAYLFDTTTDKQIAKLLPDDGAADDIFGHTVTISGATAIVGAPQDDDNGTLSGSAYLFHASTGQQIAKILPDDGGSGDRFGISVGISGTTAIVGAYLDQDNGTGSGSAYLFDISDPASPVQTAKLLPKDGAAGDRFGISVAIGGTTGREVAIVGAYLDDHNNSIQPGSAYLFDATVGRQIAKLVADDIGGGRRFGYSVAISGDTAIVGAYLDDDNGIGSGSAYLFDTTTGQQIANLLPDDGASHDEFGWAVAISGATAIVGAHFDDDNGSSSGSAYLFDAAAPGKCPADFDNSGDVGVTDLLFLLGTWGPCPPKGDCPADFDGSGDVGVKDLLFLLGAWGPCL